MNLENAVPNKCSSGPWW